MLNEEMTIMHLEMAIKKEQFRGKQKIKLQICELPIENKGLLKPSDSINETNGKMVKTVNNLLHKIRF
jgi:hypothetical protein